MLTFTKKNEYVLSAMLTGLYVRVSDDCNILMKITGVVDDPIDADYVMLSSQIAVDKDENKPATDVDKAYPTLQEVLDSLKPFIKTL